MAVESARNREARAWFAAHVSATTFELHGEPIDWMLHEWYDNGSFQASFDTAGLLVLLWREPRGAGEELIEREIDGPFVITRWRDHAWEWGINASAAFDDLPPPGDVDRAIREWLSRGDH